MSRNKTAVISFLFISWMCVSCNFLVKDEEKVAPSTAQNPLQAWQSKYAFEKASDFAVVFPEAIGPTTIVGNGTPQSVTRQALQEALDKGGRIEINSGGAPVTVYVDRTLRVSKHGTVIDGKGLLTLDARGERRIMYSVGAHTPGTGGPNNRTFRWGIQGIVFRNGRTTGGPLSQAAPSSNNDGSGNGGQAGSGAAIWIGLWNQCTIRACQFIDNQTRLSPANEETGGAVYARGGSSSELTIADSYFENNRATIGGAINSLLTNLRVVRCGFFGNRSSNHGGAIYTDGGASDGNPPVNTSGFVTLEACVFENNFSPTQGGGAFLYVYGGKINVMECIFEKNTCGTANGGLGGGLRVGNGDSQIRRCAFIDNRALGQGAGLWSGSGANFTTLVENCTFFGNVAENQGLGGAMAINSQKCSLMNCTLFNNRAHQGAGVFGGAEFVFQNSLFVDNIATNPWGTHYNIQSNLNHISRGGNLQWLTQNVGNQRTSIRNTDAENPLLEPTLDRQSGFTPIIKLQSASPARGKGITGNNAPDVDQHLKRRVGRNDAGAFQL
ncbi:choice-of-anchor Q domain-containing protein [Rhodoflexus sp.]